MKTKVNMIKKFIYISLLILFSVFGTGSHTLAVKAQDEIYEEETGTIQFLGDGTFTYENGIMTGAENRGSIDWSMAGYCAKNWNLKLVKDESYTDSRNPTYYEIREYRGELSPGDRIRIMATVYGINSEIETSIRIPDGMGGYNFAAASENPNSAAGCRVDGQMDSDISKSYTAYWVYTVQEGDKEVIATLYHDGWNTPTCNPTDEMYVEYKFIFSVGKIKQTSTTPAYDRPGEDSGTDIDDDIPGIPGGIIIGTIGVIAGGLIIKNRKKGKTKKETKEKKEDKKKEEKKPSHYKMYVFKNFGDSIKKDGKPVIVGARIVEINENNQEIQRNDLTSKIEVFSDDMTLNVQDAGMDGRYKNAKVSADRDNPHPEGVVTFRYYGEGGVFTKNVVFRLVGETKIVFPAMKEDNSAWIVNANLNETDIVSGLGGEADVTFLFIDAPEEPKEITFSKVEGLEIQAFKDLNYAYTYRAHIINNTLPMEKLAGIFADKKRQEVTINAKFSDNSTVQNTFVVNIYPDGISVPTENAKDGRVELDTLPDENAVGSYKIPPAMFEVFVCNVKDKTAIIEKNPTLTYTGFFDNDKYGNTFKHNFKYKIFGGEEISLYPLCTLPVIKDPYEAYLTIKSDRNGINNQADLPFRLTGEKPVHPSTEEWNTAFKRLQRAVDIFGVGTDPEVRALLKKPHHMSAEDLGYLRYWIILCGKQYYEHEIAEYAAIDKVMTRYIVVASAMVKVGDKAVEMAIHLHWPTAPQTLLATFVNPWKNSMAEFIGQYVGAWSIIDIAEGNPDDFELGKTFIKSFEDSFAEIITGDGYNVDPKVMGQIVSLYLMMSYSRHYFYGEGKEKGDIFRSVLYSVGDLTLVNLKSKTQKVFEKIIKWGGDKVGTFVGNYLKKYMKEGAFAFAEKMGMEFFKDSVKSSYNQIGTLTNEGYQVAHGLRVTVEDQLKTFFNENIEKGTDMAVSGSGKAINFMLAQLINYLYGGTHKENESLGFNSDEVINELIYDAADKHSEDIKKWLIEGIKKKFNIDVSGVYKSAQDILDISVRLDGNLLIMDSFGYTVEIDIVVNSEAVFNIIYEACFGWMEDLWKYEKSQDPTWDPRDDLSDDTSMVERQAKYVENLRSSAQITYKEK